MDIGKQIKTLRLAKGVTQEELAAYLGVSFQAVSKWETESSTPDIALLPNIAVFFGITIDELFQLPNEAEFERIENMFWHERQISAETFSHCVRFLEGIVQNAPKNIRALVCLARLYNHRAKADHETASGYAKTVLLLNPDEKAGWTAFLRADNGVFGDEWCDNHFGTIAYLKAFLNTNPDNVFALRAIIENLLEDTRYNEAVPYIERLREEANTYQYALYMGDVMFQKGMLQEALADYEQCFLIQDSPRLTDGLHSMAQLHEILEDYPAAIHDRERIINCLKEEYHTTSGEGINSQLREIERLKALIS